MGIVLDVSNYDYSTFDPDCFKREGVTGLIVGCQRPDLARDMIARARATFLPVHAVYAFLYFGLDSVGQTRNAIDVAKQFNIRHVTLDVESVPPHERAGITPQERIAELRQCVRMVEDAGLGVIIYTGGWYWPSYMANTQEFSSYPLWHAAYRDYLGTPYEIRTVAYGGWSAVAIHQWTSTLNICGRNRDANHVWAAPWEQEDTMPNFTANHEEMLYGLIDLLLGRADGREYVNDIERLIVLRDAIARDMRYSIGLGLTQAKLAQLAQEVERLSAGVTTDPAVAAQLTDISNRMNALSEGFSNLGRVTAPTRPAEEDQ